MSLARQQRQYGDIRHPATGRRAVAEGRYDPPEAPSRVRRGPFAGPACFPLVPPIE